MLEVSAAQRIVLDHANPLPPATKRLSAAALGRVLAEAVNSDIDMPPFAKAMMDGYAVRAADAEAGVTLRVVERVLAGQVPTRTVGAGEATEIMTGAPLPAGADAVVMVEQTTRAADAVTLAAGVKPGQNVQPRAKELQAGGVVLRPGAVIRPQELGLLAMVGRTEARLHPTTRVAVLATGDEIVEPGQPLGPGQIRNSNGPMLVGQVAAARCDSLWIGVAADTREALAAKIEAGLTADVLVLSGGVSAGAVDLVPEVLASLGVEPHFHKVRMKPGKPLLFGTRGATLVFGLPGNPVSSFVGFELFVKPALRVLTGHPPAVPQPVEMPMAVDLPHKSDRPTYYPAVRRDGAVSPVTPWQGSPDLRAVCEADCLLLLDAGERTVLRGELVPVFPLES